MFDATVNIPTDQVMHQGSGFYADRDRERKRREGESDGSAEVVFFAGICELLLDEKVTSDAAMHACYLSIASQVCIV